MNRDYYWKQIQQLLDLGEYTLAQTAIQLMRKDKDIAQSEVYEVIEDANKKMDEVSK